MNKILVVEDEFEIREMLRAFLEDAGYEITEAEDGVEGLKLFRQKSFDLVLLDIMMPKIDGYGVCEVIRNESDVPIIMLTALGSEQDQLKAYDLMIDDYITKPFSYPLLLRKVAAVLRRKNPGTAASRLTYRSTVLDLDSYQLFVDGTEIILTTREFDLLKMLLQNQGRVMTRQILIDTLWSFDFLGDDRVVDTHIKNIRKKAAIDYIETIRGVGYRIAKENKI